MIDIEKNTIDIELFHSILKLLKDSDRQKDIIESFNKENIRNKSLIVDQLAYNNVFSQESVVTIFGGWYGSIFVPLISPRVKELIVLDLDDYVIRKGKNNLFHSYSNVKWVTKDVFGSFASFYADTTCIINTSCEHMDDMNTWPWWNKLTKLKSFAFQSNNMSTSKGHINCVTSLLEFKAQLPINFEVTFEDEYTTEKGSRYTLIGNVNK
jgi:hypothetical protein